MLWPHTHQLMTTPHMQTQKNDTERQSKEARLCNNSLVFLLCGGLCNKYQATMSKKMACWTEGFCTADLDFKQLWNSYRFISIMYSSQLISNYLEEIEWQTVEKHLIHMVTSLYRRTHIMTSPISVLWIILGGERVRNKSTEKKSRIQLGFEPKSFWILVWCSYH